MECRSSRAVPFCSLLKKLSTLPSVDRMAPGGGAPGPSGRRCSGQRRSAASRSHLVLAALLSFAHFPDLRDRKGIRAALTEADIVTAHRYAEASREALARYDGRVVFDAATKEAAN
jgi:hypothetical protein